MAPHPPRIANKIRRENFYALQKRAKQQDRLARRAEQRRVEKNDPAAKERRLAANVPATIESKREYDETMVKVDADILALEDATDEFASCLNGSITPKMLITTSKDPSAKLHLFSAELVDCFPNCTYVKRGHRFELEQIAAFASNRSYTDLLIINEDQKKPNGLLLIHLPAGPTAYFRLSSVQPAAEIAGHGRATCHKPELILNNFSTRLGHTVGRFFQSLFPLLPQFEGRQVVTLHNQRDFIFFRRHRYIFKDTEKVKLQELGPRFTLKLRRLQRGIHDRKNGVVEWEFKQKMETSRRKFFL
ncbi:Brix domain-containing protein [Neolecta irregularis DAH-3]|uniref:Brix domain-containing protein n=1 Tax=Neolecta irregularis (strain DAH-3) TaxID=1198029 RepID=A0A1U7LWC5_NEOID|nr:Brix domain-containing protein [Neolecta irregularis DAH-3]|eukprot:OLL26929.1 Brix domain-containing protein [Neolecta irregularis DAH-3]